MLSESTEVVMPKKPKKENVKPIKKVPEQPATELGATDISGPDDVKTYLTQLAKSHIDVLKMMNEFNSRLAAAEVENQKLYHILAMLTKNHDEFRAVLDMLGRGMRQLKKQIEDDGSEPQEEQQESNEKKDPPIHDDVTVTCQVCDRVYNGRLEKCPRCGFTGNKNKKKGR